MGRSGGKSLEVATILFTVCNKSFNWNFTDICTWIQFYLQAIQS